MWPVGVPCPAHLQQERLMAGVAGGKGSSDELLDLPV